jgi:hypothetical protein
MDRMKYEMRYASENSNSIHYYHDRLPLSFVITEDKTLKHLRIDDVEFKQEKENVTDGFIGRLEDITRDKVSTIDDLIDSLLSDFREFKPSQTDRHVLAFNTEFTLEKDSIMVKLQLEKDYITLEVNNYLNDDYQKEILNFTGIKNSNIMDIYDNVVSKLIKFHNDLIQLDNSVFDTVSELLLSEKEKPNYVH